MVASQMRNRQQRQQDADAMISQDHDQALIMQKIKYKKLKETMEKKNFFNEQEKSILKKQLSEYNETVEA
jgi:hypothetical protein